METISDFTSLHVGDDEVFVTVQGINHTKNSFVVKADTAVTKRVEVREKEGKIAMFCLENDDVKLSDWWKDSNLLYTKEG